MLYDNNAVDESHGVENSAQTDWELLRFQFPVAKQYVYFNHAAVAPLSLSVRKQIAVCAARFCEKGIVCNSEFLGVADTTRQLAAQLINAERSQIAFVKNTTQGILVVANGIRWEKGDNVVIPEKEFPANVYPWLNLSRKGVETRFVPLKYGRFTDEDIYRRVDKRTRAVSVSAVSFTNGFRCDLEKIGQLCKNEGIIFVVDAIQALGALEIDVGKSHVDVLAADSHKWLLGPQGIGILYVSAAAMDKLEVSNLGWKSMEDEGDYLNYDIRLKQSAARFEEGTLNIVGIAGLKASLEMLLGIGIPFIQRRILALNDTIIQNLSDRGYAVKSSLSPGERSGILSFMHQDIPTEKLYAKLFENDVVCAHRDGAIRISPHFYNNDVDILRFVKALY